MTQVGLPDGSRYNFEYNNGYGMVTKIRYHAADNHLRRYTTYVAPASATDCPRLTERRDWAEGWNGDNDHIPATNEEAITSFARDGDGGCRVTLPDGTVHKEFYGSSWQSGLTAETRSYATIADANSNAWQKRTTTAWTQDNTGVSYLTNPRVVQADVEDTSGNHRRTTVDYGATGLGYVQWSLPHIVREYGVNGATATEFRRSQTDYRLTQPYLNARIIGLVSTSQLYDSIAGQWLSKTTYEYDTTAIDAQATAATQHDQNYSSAFTARGNVTAVSRWDVTDLDNAGKKLTSTITYNAAGSGISSTDPANHANTINYADAFADGVNRHTFAYPTTLTDADGFSSTVQYSYYIGAATRTQQPPPAGQSQGVIQTMLYDGAGRLERVTTENNGAYTRWVYDPFGYVSQFDTIQQGVERYRVTVWDGGGRVRGVGGNHPGSTGGYWGRITTYDVMGRVSQQTNPAEITGGWVPTGDDAAGWQYNVASEYDWQGRVRKTYNMDGTYQEASYSGCGCAGGEVVTLTDEVGRQQKVYSDVLGRTRKSEILNWNGTVYSAATNTFNARDQVTLVRQWAGAEGSGTYQETTMEYDGYGRLQSKHVPEQNAGTVTVYSYNADDTIQSVTDARGASATFGYNNRHLLTDVSYTPSAGVPDTPDTSFNYDAAGNRTSMTDGLGTQSYSYNSLSQMTSETRGITGAGNYTIGYDYNLAGQLKSITDPAGATINYGFDSEGRLNGVTGSSFGGVTTYASGLQYRAWGVLKHLTYGNSRYFDVGYNARMQASSFNMPGVMSKTYEYYADGQLRFSSHSQDHRFDRLYVRDHAGRLTHALSGAEARGEPATNDRPYKETFNFEAFGHLTSRESNIWNWQSPYSIPTTFVNNRGSDAGYDADGRTVGTADATYSFDAAGNLSTVGTYEPQSTTTRGLDGNGQQVKTVESTYNDSTQTWTNTTKYYIRSTMLGGKVLTELNESGTKHRTFVYAGSQVLATQEIIGITTYQQVTWEHRDPSDASYRTTMTTGDVSEFRELDPIGADATAPPILNEPNPPDDGTGSLLPYPSFSNPTQPGTSYRVDGISVSREYFERAVNDTFHDSFVGMAQFFVNQGSRARVQSYAASYTNSNGQVVTIDYGMDRAQAYAIASEMHAMNGTFITNWMVSDNWSSNWSFLMLGQSAYERPKETRDQAFEDAAQVLTKDEDCARFFGARTKRAIQGLSSVVERFRQNSKIDMRFSEVAKTVGAGRNALITLGQPFFGNAVFAVSKIVPKDPRLGRAETILHEIAHAFGLIKKDGIGFPKDQADKNDAIIMKHCGRGIAKIGT